MARNLLPFAWALLALPVALSVHRHGDPGDRGPKWDVASHGLNGLRMADAITRVDPLALVEELVVPHHYPPGHSLLQAPFFLALGRTHEAARLCSALAFVALVVLGGLLARRAGADVFFAPLLILAAAASSPRLLSHAAVPMLELFGGLGFLFFAVFYLRSLESPGDARKAYVAGAAATIVYLTSVNYAILLFAALGTYEFVRGDRRAAWRGVREFWRGYRPLNPWTVAAVLCLAIGAVVKFAGGWRTSWVSIGSPRGPVSVAAAVLGFHLAVELWKRREAIRRWPPRLKGFFWATVLPIAVWFAVYPPRFRNTLDFLEGAGVTPVSTGERILMYPRAWFGEYHLSAALGAVALLALVATLVTWRRQKETSRFLAILALVVTIAIFAHPMRDPRFLVAVLPLYWILAAIQIAHWGRRRVVAAAASLVLAATAWPAWRFHREELRPRILAHWYGPPGSAALSELAARDAARTTSLLLLGTADGVTWHTVEFEIRRRRAMRGFRYEKDLEHTAKSRRTTREIFDRWLSKTPEDQVVTVESPGATTPNELEDLEYMRLLSECGRYRLLREDAASVPGVRVRVWERIR